MPATSQAMQQAAAIAEHHPEQLHKENRGLLKMKQSDLHDFAATKRSGLPKRASSKGRSMRGGRR